MLLFGTSKSIEVFCIKGDDIDVEPFRLKGGNRCPSSFFAHPGEKIHGGAFWQNKTNLNRLLGVHF